MILSNFRSLPESWRRIAKSRSKEIHSSPPRMRIVHCKNVRTSRIRMGGEVWVSGEDREEGRKLESGKERHQESVVSSIVT